RLDRRLDRAKTRHDDEDRVDAVLAKLSQDIKSGNAWHPHVGKDHVERTVARQDETVFSACRGAHRVTSGAEHALHALSHGGVVVYDQNARHQDWGRHGWGCGALSLYRG